MLKRWVLSITWTHILRGAGLVGIAVEASRGIERPSLLVLYGAMIGVPELYKRDRRSSTKDDGPGDGPAE